MGDAEVFGCRDTKVVTCLSYAPSSWAPGDALQNTQEGMDGADDRSRDSTSCMVQGSLDWWSVDLLALRSSTAVYSADVGVLVLSRSTVVLDRQPQPQHHR